MRGTEQSASWFIRFAKRQMSGWEEWAISTKRAVPIFRITKSRLNDPDLTDDNGYGAHRGALCVEVGVRDICGRLSEFCGIYVCVSGADSEDDLECAFTAVPKIEEFFRNKAEETVRFELRVPLEEEVEDA